MSFDCIGLKPVNATGESFRCSSWIWRPLWEYVCKLAPELISADLHKSGHYNDGARVDANSSHEIAAILKRELESGRTLIEANDYAARQAGTPDIDCDLCDGTGIRTDRRLVNWRGTNEPRPCNGCNGLGHRRPYSTYYPFEGATVARFREFLIHCGGFEIN